MWLPLRLPLPQNEDRTSLRTHGPKWGTTSYHPCCVLPVPKARAGPHVSCGGAILSPPSCYPPLLLTGPRLPPADWTSPFGDTSLTLGESEGTPMQPTLPESLQAGGQETARLYGVSSFWGWKYTFGPHQGSLP